MIDSKELTEVEMPAVQVLIEHLGWTEIESSQTKEMRPSLKDAILIPKLLSAIKRLNPWISDENAHRVVREITHVQATSLIEANEKIHGILEKGTTVMQDKNDGLGLRSQDVFLIDFNRTERNEYNVVRQFVVTDHYESIPDVVLFINGMPIVIIECKSPILRDPIAEGMEQLVKYQEAEDRFRSLGCPKLFNTVQIVVATSKDKTKYATIYTPERHWSEWKDHNGLTRDEIIKLLGKEPAPQDIFLFGVCSIPHLLDIIQNFVVFERERGKVVKKVAKYQQYRAVNKIVGRILFKRKQTGTRGGVVWHSQGSGKSLSMLWTGVKLRRQTELENPTIVIITDRTDLDDQIIGTFRRCGFPNPIQAASAKNLQELLKDPVGQTIMTTIQKFQDATDIYPVLTESSNVFVLVDEAHRTQYKMLAANMRRAIRNGYFIGFTGTPISKKYRNTLETFGDYVDVYDHKQAERDGATVPIMYESRLPEISVSGNSIEELFNRIFSDYPERERARIKQKFVTLEAIHASEPCIRLISLDIIKHYEGHIMANGFKAQIVACSRLAATKYKKIFDELNGPSSEVLISKSHHDEAEYAPHHKSKTEEEEVIRRFKEEEDPKIIIVCDKLLTGFDAPVEQVMYLDSSLKEHTLLQAIARVNRPYGGKRFGLVVDYWGVSEELQKALDMFTPEERKEVINTDYKKEVLARLQAAHNAAMNFFWGVNISDIEECVQFLRPEDKRLRFDQRFLLFANYLDMLYPDPSALSFVKDFKWLSEIRIRARNRYRDEQLSLKECSGKIRKLIEEHISANGITHLIGPTSVFSERFEEQVNKLESPEAKASEIEHAVRHEINVKLHEDPVFYESISEKLSRIIIEYKEGRINAARQLDLLQEIVKEIKHPEKHASDLGLDEEVVPFYHLLNKHDEKNKNLKNGANEVFKALEELAVVEWQYKEDIQREMRSRIKGVLRTIDYPQDKIEPITLEIIQLAKARLKK